MSNFKKIFAALIALVLVVGMLPFGTLAEAVFSQNEFTNNIWNAAKFIASPTDYVVDVVIDSTIEAAGEAADAIEDDIPPFDAAINDCYKELESLNAAA